MIVFCDPQNIKKHPNWAPLRAADEKLCSISNAKPRCAKTQRITQCFSTCIIIIIRLTSR